MSIRWSRGLSRLFWSTWLLGWAVGLWVTVADARASEASVEQALGDALVLLVWTSIAAALLGRVIGWVLDGFRG